MKVCVLISTYNGEKYLEDQLQSVCSQKGVDIDILVRDDGSTDSTCNILNDWQKHGKLTWYKGDNLGFALSFIDLVVNAPKSDYYALCDQDDIWLPEKLSEAVNRLEHTGGQIKLYCSNAYLYKDGVTIGKLHDSAPSYDKYTCLLKSIAPGCTMVFDESLKNIVHSANPDSLIAHDLWVYQIAEMLGTVVYDHTPHMKYRQHKNNTIGHNTSWTSIWRNRIRRIMYEKQQHPREMQARELIECYSDEMNEENLEIISRVAYYRNSIKDRYRLLTDKRYTMGTPAGNVMMRLRILLSRL